MRMSRIAVAALALAFGATEASADPVVVNQWYSFGFGGVGSGASPAFPVAGAISAPNAPWTITTLNPIAVTVQDAFLNGDQFQLFNGATLIGTTSAPTGGPGCGSSIAACTADPNMSHGTFLLAAGSYSFEIVVTQSPFGAGDALFRIEEQIAAVPEPSTYVLMATGLAAIAGVARRRRQRA